jgi:glucosamine--fructose-6-phosphate aminotransferase (isomerizing)
MSRDVYSVIEGPYLHDILEQPQALRATLEYLRTRRDISRRIAEIREQGYARIILTGMGSSLHALYPLNLMLAAHGETVCQIETSELIHSMPSVLRSDSVIVAASQSGQSAEILRLLQQNEGRAKVIGICNTEDSPLVRGADFTILTRCGEEFSVSAKTYVAALVALEVLGALWCGIDHVEVCSELSNVAEHVAGYLADWREHVNTMAGQLTGIRQLFILGRGRSLASCRTGALIVKESTRLFAEAMSSAAFRHGPIEVLDGETLVIVFDGDPSTRELNRKLVKEIRDREGQAWLIGAGAEVPVLQIPDGLPRALPILEILPIQMLTLALAARSGFEAGRFEYAMKITAVE